MLTRSILINFLVYVFVFNTAIGAEPATSVPASLDEAKTYEEIAVYTEHVFVESRKNMKTMEDHDQFLKTYPPVGIAAGRKIIALGGNDESLEYGYGILLSALDWSCRKHPGMLKEFEMTFEELKKTGKFPAVVAGTRFSLLYQHSRLFEKEIPTKQFSEVKDGYDALVKEAKELIVLKEDHGHFIGGPQTLMLDLAREISIAHDKPQFLEDVLEDLVSYVTSDRFEEKERARNESFLRGYRRRMVGSPFELWGKTVDGADFNWNDFKGKVVLIDFTASWCGPCRAEMSNVVEMYNQFHDKRLEVVCVGYHDTTENLKKMIEEDKIAFTMISEELSKGDSRGIPSEYYGIRGIPEIFLIGKDGQVITTEIRGPAIRDYVEKQFIEEDKQ